MSSTPDRQSYGDDDAFWGLQTSDDSGIGTLSGLVRSTRGGADPSATEDFRATMHTVGFRYAKAMLGGSVSTNAAAAKVAEVASDRACTELPSWLDALRDGGSAEALMRDAVVETLTDQVDSEPDAPPAEPPRGEATTLWPLLERLSAVEREILVLRIAVGMTAAETAAAMFISPREVLVTQHRSMSRLRSLMAAREGQQ